MLQVFDAESTKFQEFKNLRNLLLDRCDLTDNNFKKLGVFLWTSPNLERLTLQSCMIYGNLEYLKLWRFWCEYSNGFKKEEGSTKTREDKNFVSLVLSAGECPLSGVRT